MTTWTPQTDNGEPPVERAYISEQGDVVVTDLNDVTYINTFIADNAGKQVRIVPHADGYHSPDILETGTPIDIPAETTVVFVGEVEIRTRCPTRPVFHLSGDGAALIGTGKLVANYDRPVFDAVAGAWTTWATTWNAANPDYPVANWLTQDWETSWDAANPQAQYASIGALGKANRTSAVTSYDANNLTIDGLTITGFHTGVCLQGMDVTAANASETPNLQTTGNVVRNITLDEFDFGILAKKQRNFTVDSIVSNWIGHRVNRGQPHVVYLSNSSDVFEESWNVDIGTITAYGYEGGTVFKARACKNLTWKAINCYSVHNAVSVIEACEGIGGDVLVTDQHETTDAVNGAGAKFAINIVNAPGFIMGGAIRIEQRAGEDVMKAWTVENSDGVRFLQGCEVICARATDGELLFRCRSSDYVYSGVTKYTDLNARGTLLFTMSDSQDEGGNASNCVIEFGQVIGTDRLVEFAGLSSNNQVWVDPSKVDLWDATTALVDNGLGGGNVLIDPRETVKKVLAVSASTDLTLKASNTLTIEREGPDPLDEDALPMPRLFSNNDTITIGSTTYTWKTVLSGAANEILIPNAAIVAAYPTMTAEYGYLQLAFINAAIMGTNYKGADAGEIYGTGTVTNTQVESEWGGNQINFRALAAGSSGNSIACSVSMTGGYATWADGTTSDTLTGGGGVDQSLMSQTVAVTTGTNSLTMTLPASPPEGTFINFVKTDSAVGDFTVTGFEAIKRQSDELRLTYSDGAWRGIYMPSVIRGISHGDVFIPEALTSAAINAEIARMGTRDKLRLRSGKTYDITELLDFDGKEVLVDADGALLQVNANVAGMRAQSGIIGPYALTVDYEAGDTTLTVASTTGLRVGSWLKIVSDAVDPGNRNQGTGAAQWRMAEWALITALTSTVITIASPLEFPWALSGELTPADPLLRDPVETYTIANNARLFGPAVDYFRWEGGTWEYEDGHDATDGTGWRQKVMRVAGYHAPEIEGVEIIRGYDAGISLGTYGGIVRDCWSRNLSDKFVIGGTASNLGYGVTLNGYGETVIGGGGNNCRHVTTTGSAAVAIGATTESSLYDWGPTFDASFIGMVGGGQRTAVFGTHADAIRSRHISCRVNGSQNWMFDIRGRDNWLIDCGGTGELGVRSLTEWSDGADPDEPGVSGQDRKDCTSLTVVNLDIKVRERAIQSQHSTLRMTGVSKIECDTHAAVLAFSGGLIEFVDGQHQIKITGRANSADYDDYKGVFTAYGTAPTELGITGFKGIKFHRGANVDVDATDAADTVAMRLFAYGDATDHEAVVYGRVSAILNASFDLIINGSTLTIDNNADFEISGFSGTRETRSYFHTLPSGIVEGSGFVDDLADDAYVSIPIPVNHGIATVFLSDDAPVGALTSVAMSMAFNDSSTSTSERASLLSGDTTYCEVIVNSKLDAGEGTDGKLVMSYYNSANTSDGSTLRIKNRLGKELDVYWTVRGSTAFGSV